MSGFSRCFPESIHSQVFPFMIIWLYYLIKWTPWGCSVASSHGGRESSSAWNEHLRVWSVGFLFLHFHGLADSRSAVSSALSHGSIHSWQAPDQRGRRQGVPPCSMHVNLVCICLLKIRKHKKTDPRAFHSNPCSHYPQERKSKLSKCVPITVLSGLLFSFQ